MSHRPPIVVVAACGLVLAAFAGLIWAMRLFRAESVDEERGGLAALTAAAGPDVLASLSLVAAVSTLLVAVALYRRSRDAWRVAVGLQAVVVIEGVLRLPGEGLVQGALLVLLAVAVAAALVAPTARRWVC